MKLEEVALKILSFDPGDDADCVVVGIKRPIEPSATRLTWQDIRRLAAAALPQGSKLPIKTVQRAAAVQIVWHTNDQPQKNTRSRKNTHI